jgi:FAD/FMN-containing dehydrogenase
MVNEETIKQFRATFRGELIQPTDNSYDNARKVYNGMIDRRPRIIAYCTDASDVINAVNFGRENKLLMSIRGGGHNAGGLGICDDGLVIDLSKIKYSYVDPEAGTVRVGGGNTWGMLTTLQMDSAM